MLVSAVASEAVLSSNYSVYSAHDLPRPTRLELGSAESPNGTIVGLAVGGESCVIAFERK